MDGENKPTGKLYLIPNTLGSTTTDPIPESTRSKILGLKFFLAEEIRNARRYLSAIGLKGQIRDLEIGKFHRKATKPEVQEMLAPLLAGEDMGLLSEAGCPCIADPGEKVVMMAHKLGLQVVPLVGPSSIIMALIASGLNAEDFTFNGYLPIDRMKRIKQLDHLEQRAVRFGRTQMFMETPYRNNQMLESILKNCSPDLFLSISCSLTCEDEYVRTARISDWKKGEIPDLHKRPCIFLLGTRT